MMVNAGNPKETPLEFQRSPHFGYVFWVRNIRLRDGFCFRGTRTLHQRGLASPSLMRPKVISHSEPIWCSLVLNRGAGKSLMEM